MLKEVEGVAGAPWERELAGSLHKLVVESEVLKDNPLGDPARRPLYVYEPPGSETDSSSIYVLQGFTGQVDMWFRREAFVPTMIERIDDLFGRGNAPPALIVFVDCWTSYGGSQFINSPGTGRYMDYLCDEVATFVDGRFGTSATRDRRGIAGKSSGGYGAMVTSMLRPDVFGAFASHAGDALFEVCYLPDFRNVARTLRKHFDGSFEVFWEQFRAADSFKNEFHDPLNIYAMAACYSPDETRVGEVQLPFDIATGRLVPEVWERWLAWDPVRMASAHVEALSRMKLIYLDAGLSDDFFLDLGAQAFSAELKSAGIEHRLDLFEGTHANIAYRYPGALKALAEALAP